MMRSLTLSALVAGALLAAPAINAQTRPAATPAAAPARPAVDEATRTFRAWDKNGDSQLSLAEFTEGFQRAQAAVQVAASLRRQFATIDAGLAESIARAAHAHRR